MLLNIAFPTTGSQVCIEEDDEKKLRALYDKRMSQEVDGAELNENWGGYVFRITGGNDKQGFPMKQGVLSASRVRLLLKKGQSCFRERRAGSRKRKSVRGCFVGPDMAVVNLVIVKKGANEIEKLTDVQVPRRLGPKRASKIRKMFNLEKDDDVRKYVVGRETKTKKGNTKTKRPKIQRLVTPVTVQRKRAIKALKRTAYTKAKSERAEYEQMMQKIKLQQKEARKSKIAARRSRLSKARASKHEN